MSTTAAFRRSRGAGQRGRGAKRVLGPRETRRLVQLGVCIAVFLLVFLGNGIFPGRMETLRVEALALLHQTTDFKAAFGSLGESIAQGAPVMDSLGGLWVEVFGGTHSAEEAAGGRQELGEIVPAVPPEFAMRRLTRAPTVLPALLARPVPVVQPAATPEPAPAATPQPAPTSRPYDGPPLPQRVSMDYVDLGLGETTTPVLGVLTSEFGYRDHPVDGAYKFHYGTDIYAEVGTDITAFADGVVDYIGESPAYGMYLQVGHPGGVTSFYAHCSKLCVGQGETVAKGQTIAEVGKTGNATGPHLHLELKRDGIFYDPAYYVTTR